MKPHVVYLHGFGSGPQSEKGLALQRRLQERVTSFTIPSLDGGDFFNLTMTNMRERAHAALDNIPPDGNPIIVIGSSLGGYTAAWLAADRALPPRVTGMLLIAPAFGFTARWSTLLGPEGVAAWRRDGRRLFYHHGLARDEWLSSAFLDSCADLPEIPRPPLVLTTIIHGRQDETIDWNGSRRYAEQSGPIHLHVVDGNHRLTEQKHEKLAAELTVALFGKRKK